MDIDAYIDSIMIILDEQGIVLTPAQREKERDGIAMAHMKGRDWTKVATSVLRRHGIEVK